MFLRNVNHKPKFALSNLVISLCIFFSLPQLTAQQYEDYLGYGQSSGILISSSHNKTTNHAHNILTGPNVYTDLKGASRFLRQATIGSNYESISSASQIGLTQWLEDQFSLEPSSFYLEHERIYNEADDILPDFPDESLKQRDEFLSYTFYEMAIKKPDVLRQKLAFSLSQIFVISPPNSRLSNRSFSNASFYDVLYQGAFGNFRDLLYDVTMHPVMGIYLSHIRNEKADIIQGSFPDENYAREIMQLFTIGLLELNPDGSFKRDLNGHTIPTYDNQDIQELAKVFTGLSGGVPAVPGSSPLFHSTFTSFDLTKPMKMYQNYHDETEKIMIDGTVLPADQAGMDDINAAIDILFNHENVAPFIGLRLIQHLVKSNPSPEYINRISSIFNNNGHGVRGDLKAVIKGILLDPEARQCEWINHPSAGKLVQPVERMTHLFSGFDIKTPSDKYWFRDELDVLDKVQQSFLAAPTVFNFYTPFFAENDYVAPNHLVSPEFQILNSVSAIHNLNITEDILKKLPFGNRTQINSNQRGLAVNILDNPYLDFSDELNLYDENNDNSIDLILNRLDIILCSGQLKLKTKAIIKNTIIQNRINDNSYSARDVINDAVYFITISPDYIILK